MTTIYIKRQVRDHYMTEYTMTNARYTSSSSLNMRTKRFTIGSYADKFFSTLFFATLKKKHYEITEIDSDELDYAMKIFAVGKVQDAKNWRFWAAMYEHLVVAKKNILLHIDAHNISVNLKLWRK